MPAKELEKLLSPVFRGEQRLEQVYHPETDAQEEPRLIAEGYEVRVELKADVDGQQCSGRSSGWWYALWPTLHAKL